MVCRTDWRMLQQRISRAAGLGEDQLYFVLRGKDLRALADALEVLAEANQGLGQYASKRRDELASV